MVTSLALTIYLRHLMGCLVLIYDFLFIIINKVCSFYVFVICYIKCLHLFIINFNIIYSIFILIIF